MKRIVNNTFVLLSQGQIAGPPPPPSRMVGSPREIKSRARVTGLPHIRLRACMLNEYPRHREPGSGATNFFDVAVL